MRFSDTLLQKKRRQSESNRPLSNLSTDLLVMSRNQLGKRGYIKVATMLKDIADARTFRFTSTAVSENISRLLEDKFLSLLSHHGCC